MPIDDMVQWCYGALQGLNREVNARELLSILLSLPPSTDTKEIIADTIYSNSSTMDGHRFADEFLKRRAAAEKVRGALSWTEILNRHAENKPADESWDPSFQVVVKKRGKRAAGNQ
jgi:PERQ amino acid-rich with GYF domain-containing protein